MRAGSADGFLKRFLFGETLVAYRDGDAWRFSINRKVFTANDVKEAKIKKSALFVTLNIVINGDKYRFREFSFWDYVSRSMDPTYDIMDAEEVFVVWFFNKLHVD